MFSLRVLSLLLLAGVGAWFLAGSRDLVQVNSLDLFLEKEGLARYESFRERFNERPTLLGRLRLPPDAALDRSRLDAGLDAVIALAARSEVELISSRDLPSAALPDFNASEMDAGASESVRGSADLPRPLLELHSARAESFLAILPAGGDGQLRADLGADLVAALLDLHESTGLEIDLAGVPYSRAMLDVYSSDIGETLFPLVFTLGFLIVLVLTRELRAALVVYLPALIATGISLALIESLYGSMDMVSSIVPLLMFVLNLGLSLHLRAATLTLGSLGRGLEEKARPIGLMVLTTTVGFGALMTSGIESIHRFGVLAALLVVVTAGTTLLWTILAAPRRAESEDEPHLKPHSRLVRAALYRPPGRAVAVGIIACAGFGLWGVGSLPIETDALTYFPASSGTAERVRALQVEVLGTPVFEIVATPTAGEQGSLEALDRVTRTIHDTLGGEVRVLSRSSLLREAQRRIGGRADLPGSPIVAMAIWSALPHPLKEAYGGGDQERITVFAENRGANEQRLEIERLNQALASAAPGWQFSYEGMVHELLSAQGALIRVLGESFALSALIIAGIFWLSCRRFKLVAVFLLTNAIPVLGGLGFVAALGFSLNVATVMVASVALGMIVDSTLHIVHALERRRDEGAAGGVDERYIRSTLEPVLASGAILIPCFLSFGAFGFLPIREFGVTLASMIALALLFDLHAVPSLVEWALREKSEIDTRGGSGDSGIVEGFSSSTAEMSAKRAPKAASDSATQHASERRSAISPESLSTLPPVIIVGAGTAGLTCAARLAAAGRSVLVLEASDGAKRHVCGEYLCPSGVTVLGDLGWLDLLEGCAPIEGMVLVAPDGRVVEGDFPRDGDHHFGVAIDKQKLIEALAVRARALGAEIRYGVRVTRLESIDRGWRVHLADGTWIESGFLVGADGRRSPVARALGVTLADRPRRVSVRGFVTPVGIHARRGEMHVGEDGSYVGVNPISPNEVNVSICLDRDLLKKHGGPVAALEAAVARSPRLRERYDWTTLRDVRGAYPVTHRVRRAIGRRAALIGDAGGFLDPLTGEGITIALWTGATLAAEVSELLETGNEVALEAALRRFARRKTKRFGPKALLSRTLQGVIARPTWCNAIGRYLDRSPVRMRIFLGAIGNHYTPPRALLRLLCAPAVLPRRGPRPGRTSQLSEAESGNGAHG